MNTLVAAFLDRRSSKTTRMSIDNYVSQRGMTKKTSPQNTIFVLRSRLISQVPNGRLDVPTVKWCWFLGNVPGFDVQARFVFGFFDVAAASADSFTRNNVLDQYASYLLIQRSRIARIGTTLSELIHSNGRHLPNRPCSTRSKVARKNPG